MTLLLIFANVCDKLNYLLKQLREGIKFYADVKSSSPFHVPKSGGSCLPQMTLLSVYNQTRDVILTCYLPESLNPLLRRCMTFTTHVSFNSKKQSVTIPYPSKCK